MGDRGNIRFTFGQGYQGQQRGEIYLYAHWHGYRMPMMLRDALKAAEGRWGDDSYLCRSVVTHMVNMNRENLDITGWGLSPYLTDNEYPITECNVDASTVTISDKTWTFAEFCALSDNDIQQAYR